MYLYLFTGLSLIVIITISKMTLHGVFRKRATKKILEEIKHNVALLQIIIDALSVNHKLFKGDWIKVFECTKGFFNTKIEDTMFFENKHLLDKQTFIKFQKIYKVFAVVEDILNFVKKINSEKEIKLFFEHFKSVMVILNLILKKEFSSRKEETNGL